VHDKRQREDQELKQIEEDLSKFYEEEGGGYLTQETKEALARMEGRRNALLHEKEESWRLKSRAIWLESGDGNTKFFHAYANGRKFSNTIWNLEFNQGEMETYFYGMARVGVTHFQSLFKATNQVSIAEVVRLAQFFPRFVEMEDNRSLMAEISEEELKEALFSFQKDIILGSDGWTIEFFQELYDILGPNILKVVEDSQQSGNVLANFNSTFIALIPKSDNPLSLDDFQPISLCNCIYKVISRSLPGD